MRTIGKLRLDGLLSFAPGSTPFELKGLNVLIGPNGSGKSNLIEVLELLSATPRDLAAVVRDGGGPAEWLWKGRGATKPAEIEVELDQGTPIPATRLSDGTIRFIALLATLLSPSPPPLVCIEEPELGLHPDAVALLGGLLVDASERMQLVVTTHSDALVSALTNHPDSIVACERPGAGTVLRRLDSTKLGDWLDEYRLGDLWRMGDLGANP